MNSLKPYKKLFDIAVEEFITLNENADERKIILKSKFIHGVSSAIVADQIVGRRKAKLKLPTWYAAKKIIYPPSLNLEQCSSETTATFKVEILKQNVKTGFNSAADLTGGFGVDSFFLSSLFKEVDYVEPDKNLYEITQHNHSILQKSRIHHHNTTAEQFLNTSSDHFDLIYIDPSRRTIGNKKISSPSDCAPDITKLLDTIFIKTDYLLLKASPMLDLQQGINELKRVLHVFVVSVDNECKEVLYLCKKDFANEAHISAVNLKKYDSTETQIASFDFLLSEERHSIASFSNPLTYLYEPNAAILKSGAFKLLANRYRLHKLQQNTHLYTSDNLEPNFPGKVFKIDALIKPDAKIIKQHFPEGKANVVTRNYPLSPEQLKKKTGLKDGGEKFLIGFSGQSEKFTAVCNRILN